MSLGASRSFSIYRTGEGLLLVRDDSSNNSGLQVSANGAVKAVTVPSPLASKAEKLGDGVYLIGLKKLLASSVLLVAKRATNIATIFGDNIFKLQQYDSYLISPNDSVSNAQIANSQSRKDEERYKKMLENVLVTDGLYFSYDFDLTRSLQSNISRPASPNSNNADQGNTWWNKWDGEFWWNQHLLLPFLQATTASAPNDAAAIDRSWFSPLILGCVQMEKCILKNKGIEIILISRRHVKRAGARYVRRGIDKTGNVANFVETEQIAIIDNTVLSFVQVRGSIPLFWSQSVDLSYKPKIALDLQSDPTGSSLKLHLDAIIQRYGNSNNTLVTLIDQKGGEGRLGQAYESFVQTYLKENSQNLPAPLRYFPFDFHSQTKGMKYENLKILLNGVRDDIIKQGFLELSMNNSSGANNSASRGGLAESGNFTITAKQHGVCRVNCIDSLDRTNVVEAMFARESLNLQLRKINLFSQNESVLDHPSFEQLFKNIWANNGDTVSMQYSGTRALKGDFTRTGKRNLQGKINDGINSLTRYYLNNFKDGYRQDSYDLFLGNYVPNTSSPSPFAKRDKQLQSVKMVMLFLTGLFIIYSMLPPSSSVWVKAVNMVFIPLSLWGTWKFFLRNGKVFLDKPLLSQ